jgi:anaphase-promoting complex subunit 5
VVFNSLLTGVPFSFQNNDDACLAYILGAISNLLSKIGITNTLEMIGSPYSLGTNIGLGTPLSIQQQLLVLLKRSLKRADTLKLPSLLSFDHLSLAKFDLKVKSFLVFELSLITGRSL